MKELEVTVRSGGLQLRQPEPVLESPLLAHTYLIFFEKKKPSLLIFFEKKAFPPNFFCSKHLPVTFF